MSKKKVKVLPTGEIIFKGVKYPGYRKIERKDSFKPEKWFKFWNGLIKEIKSSKLTYSGISNLYDEFRTHIFAYGGTKEMGNKSQETMQLMTNLNFALIKAYNNYLDSKGKFWAFFFGFSADKILNKMKPGEISKILRGK